jgi:DNA polymerase I-like protein with 3'-5' exonuclease and polymerase domains
MGERSLALRIKKPLADARELLRLHKRTFPDFWAWADAVVNFAVTRRYQLSRLGWRRVVNGDPNIRSLANWPVQTCGAEMLRVAIMYAVESGVHICAPIHDALLIEAPVEDFEEQVSITRKCMGAASELLLDGFEIGTDIERVIYPDRYMDERGIKMWKTISRILYELPN